MGIEKAFDIINMNAGVYLYSKYKQEYEKEVAVKIASAVTNEIFGHKPSNEIGIKYLEDNKKLIEEKLGDLKREKTFCHYVSIAIHLQFNKNVALSKVSGDNIIWTEMLATAGILIPIAETDMPKSNSELFKITNNFTEWVQQTKDQ